LATNEGDTMDKSRLILAFSFLLLGLVYSSSSANDSSVKDCSALYQVSVCPQKAQVSATKQIKLAVEIYNRSKVPIYVLKETWSGGVWVDKAQRSIYVAHYAYTKEREIALTGGYSSRDFYSPSFYCLKPGEKRKLKYVVSAGNELGRWEINAIVSIFTDVNGFSGFLGEAARLGMSQHDCILKSRPVVVIIK